MLWRSVHNRSYTLAKASCVLKHKRVAPERVRTIDIVTRNEYNAHMFDDLFDWKLRVWASGSEAHSRNAQREQ